MARLPVPGSDEGEWGEILNTYLRQAHDDSGNLKANSVGQSQLQPDAVSASEIADNSIGEAQLDSSLQSKVNVLSMTDAADLTDGGDSGLHHHSSDRNRANHTGAQAIATITGLQAALDGKANSANDRYYNAKLAGAVGDGVTDDRQALQDALDNAVAEDKILYIPPGTYLISGAISVTARLAVLGAGWDTVIKLADNTNSYAFVYDGVFDNRGFIGYLKIDGNCAEQTAGGGIDAPGAVESLFEHVHFLNCFDYGLRLAGFNGGAFGHHNRVRNCQFDLTVNSDGVGGGIHLTSSDENYIVNNTFAFLGGAVNPRMINDQAGMQLIEGNTFVGSQGGTTNVHGVHLESGGRTSVIANIFDGVGGDNIFVKGQNHLIANNRFTSIGDQGTVAASGVHFEFEARGNVLSGNSFETSDGAAGDTRSYVRESTGDPGENTIIGNNFPDGTLTVGKLELNTSAAIPTKVVANQGVDDEYQHGYVYFDSNSNRIGVNKPGPAEALDVIGNIRVADAATETKGYRMRTSGGSLDFDFSGADAFVSVFSGANYGGAQRTKMRLEAGADVSKLINLWEFTDSPYGAVNASIDGATGAGTFSGLRVNQSPTVETITPTHTFTININGTLYKIPIAAA